MKILTLIIPFLIFSFKCNSQNYQLKLLGDTNIENQILDSIDYSSNHNNTKSIENEIILISEKLYKLGYLENQFIKKNQENDSCFFAKFRIGKKTKTAYIYIGNSNTIKSNEKTQVKKSEIENNIEKNESAYIKKIIEWNSSKDTLSIPFMEVENYLQNTLQKLERQGYAFAKLQLKNFKKVGNNLFSELQIETNTARNLNSIIIKFNSDSNQKNSFPTGHLTQINRKYKNYIFNKKNIDEIYEDFRKFKFVSQLKYPEILFTKDSTKVYVYLEEKKSNTFDGFFSFTNNNNNKISFNGYLDLKLENALKTGEEFFLFWKSDGNNQKTFRTSIEIPYLFKSPFGIKAKIDIFKQDSIFQNTKSELNLGYYINYNTRIFIGYQSTESSDIQNSVNNQIKDFKNSFYTSNIDYYKLNKKDLKIPLNSKFTLQIGIGRRNSNENGNNSKSFTQAFFNIHGMNNFYLNTKNSININYHNYFLKSNNYIINELFRFGGINSVRGFAENSFQAHWMSSIQTEYRYNISPSLYLHSIFDQCYFEDKSLNIKKLLTGIGTGIGLYTKTGLFKFAYVNGIIKNDNIKLSNSIIHLNYSIQF